MLDPDTINQQLALLAAHRRTLAHLLQQAAQYGGVVFAPPQTANGLAEARQQIHCIKAALRKSGVQVENAPNDEAPPQIEPLHRAGGDVVSRDKVMGDNRTVDTGGGDYAEGNIDKRQGIFVEGGTVQGPVIGDNQGMVNVNYNYQPAPALSPALHQLRAPVGDFVGREQEIDQLVAALSKAAGRGAAAAISGVRGMGGIGKTELAYVVANRLSNSFPDAQLIVELRGASSSPMTPEAALQQVIRSFPEGTRMAEDVSQLQVLYRSVLNNKRVLILADDAYDVRQIRPLLPPPGCGLLVTSRSRFSLPGMQTVDLEVLPRQEAEALLVDICPRIGEHVRELAKLCGYLPLALRVAANLLKENDSRDVGRYLEHLRAERLKHLADPDNADDPQVSVEASLRLSCDILELAAQSALCQMSVFPASFDLEAAKAVVKVEGDVGELLELLRRRSLLEWNLIEQRYDLHDLVREFAATQLKKVDIVRLRHAQYYATIINYASNILYSHYYVTTKRGWINRERVHIQTAWNWILTHVGDPEVDELLLTYAKEMLYVGGSYYDERLSIPQFEMAIATAQRLGHLSLEAVLLSKLANNYFNLGEIHQAIDLYEKLLVIVRELEDRFGERDALNDLGFAYLILGEMHQAIECYNELIAIVRELGNRYSEMDAMGNLGFACTQVGDIRRAIDYYEQWLVIAREVGDCTQQANALGNLGLAYLELGEISCATDYCEQALEVAQEMGHYAEISHQFWNLGLVYAKQGDLTQAIKLMQARVDYLYRIGHPDWENHAVHLDRLRQRLAAQTSPAASHKTPPAEKPDEG